jgi:N6-L-threonylcarbamoyladenine synthase
MKHLYDSGHDTLWLWNWEEFGRKSFFMGNFGTSYRSYMKMLGIESTCDDTGIAIVTEDRRILADIRYSQASQHEGFGGVVPHLAGHLHKERLPRALNEALRLSGTYMEEIEGISMARGPGLGPCLREGLLFARKIGHEYQKKLYGIHHMEAHSLVTRFEHPDLEFPFLSLLISGGHTLMVIHEKLGRNRVIGSSLDDSIGEAFDKVSRWLGLRWMSMPYGDAKVEEANYREGEDDIKKGKYGLRGDTDPVQEDDEEDQGDIGEVHHFSKEDRGAIKGVPKREHLPKSGGAALEQCALNGNTRRFRLPIPMKGRIDCNFSFSGLKTAVRRLLDGYPPDSLKDGQFVADVAASFQYASVEHLFDRLSVALNLYKIGTTRSNISTVVVAGGVACNQVILQR